MDRFLARAEEFETPLAAKRRYRELGRLLRAHGQTEGALINAIIEGRYVILLLADISVREWAHEGHPGRLVDVHDDYWRAVILRHERRWAAGHLGYDEIHHERPVRLKPDGTTWPLEGNGDGH